MTASITSMGDRLHPSTQEAPAPIPKPENPPDPVEQAIHALRAAVSAKVAEADERAEGAEIDAAQAMSATEKAQDDLQAATEGVGGLVTTAASRLHDQARHAGSWRLCTDEACTVWSDLARAQGWGS